MQTGDPCGHTDRPPELSADARPNAEGGYTLLIAIVAVGLFAIFSLATRSLWETEIRRDMEEELVFRAEQYVQAIQRYVRKNSNRYPPSLDVLAEEKLIRRMYKEPMSDDGQWNVVMQPLGRSKKLLIVPPDLVAKYLSRARLIGVCPTSTGESYRVYREKKRYHEWAFYLGAEEERDMPELEYVRSRS